MRTKNLLLILLFFLSYQIHAQNKYEIAKELKEKYPDENLIITDYSTQIEFSKILGKMVAVESTRINFLGLEKNVRFQYPIFYSDYNKLMLKSTKGGIMTGEYAYNSSGVFHNDIKVRLGRYVIDKFADECSFDTDLLYNDLRYITHVYFNNMFHVVNREIKFTIPNNVKVELILLNFEAYNIDKKEIKTNSSTEITYTVKNLEKFSNEENMPGRSYIYPHILIRVLEYSHKNNTVKLFDTTDDLYGWYSGLVNEVEEKPDTLTNLVNKLTEGKSSDIDKISSIYYWVQDNIRYIAFEDGIAGFKPASCQKVYREKYGDCKGMSNLTKHMLKIAGYDARLAWLGTKRLAYDYSTPSLVVDNHVICAVKKDDEFIYLDPTAKYLLTGNVYEGIQERNVIIENNESFILEKLPGSKSSDNVTTYDFDLKLVENNVLEANLIMTKIGEVKMKFLNFISSIDNNDQNYLLKRFLAKFNNHIHVSNVDFTRNNRTEELNIKATLNISDKVSVFDDEMYIYPDPIQFLNNSKIDSERDVPLWFDQKSITEVNVDFKIPKGYKIQSLPEGFELKSPGYMLLGKLTSSADVIKYKLKVSVNDTNLDVSDFKLWNENIKIITNFYNQPIILKKYE